MKFSFQRWLGILIKEFIQLRRDKLTFGMVIGIPIIQLLLFGFAINSDPKHLPTVSVVAEPGPMSRSYLAAISQSGYFDLKGDVSPKEAERLLASGEAQFAIHFPVGFEKDLIRGKTPSILVETDATDPMAIGGATSVLNKLGADVLAPDLPGRRLTSAPLLELRLHRRYNAEGITAYNVVPGLCGVILTMTMVMMTSLAMTRERERGTFENLLATPATPLEVMTGKIIPYVLIGLVQVTLILLAAYWLFHVPMVGNLVLLYAVILLFICANLTLGITFSSLARNQLQAMQMTFFFFLPSMLLSGFMFPFRGMPEWAQWVGNLLPLTHFLILVRGILLKGNELALLWGHIWPIVAFMVVIMLLGLKTYRKTLD
ncbi:ABC transporter permease [Leeia sp. TBRC 13508]|uniref:ABC transporter permease n=1 Tax=Leeia speluncae TaxID=2884804 RepID=A0ABS8D4L1_9NEIS|nr:ABC transporter permease [Leeia speluncae]MCB6183159.1 ABC transporter permease [Leeia speluncae]